MPKGSKKKNGKKVTTKVKSDVTTVKSDVTTKEKPKSNLEQIQEYNKTLPYKQKENLDKRTAKKKKKQMEERDQYRDNL